MFIFKKDMFAAICPKLMQKACQKDKQQGENQLKN